MQQSLPQRSLPQRIGLTGGIACGKSTVAAFFQALGVTILDADAINRQLLQPEAAGWQKLVNYFGLTILQDDQTLNKVLLREKIFNDAHLRAAVENLLHPLIWQVMEEQYQSETGAYVIFMVPLLLEKKHQQKMDRVLLVDCPAEIQRQRLAQRLQVNLDSDLIDKILYSQLPRLARLSLVTDCLNGQSLLPQLKASVQLLHDFYQKIA
jgi:dephospho-CoA kinase